MQRMLLERGCFARRRRAATAAVLAALLGAAGAALAADSTGMLEPPVSLVVVPDLQPPRLATLRWNLEARNLVRRSRADPLWAVRTYALLSVAQQRAADSAREPEDVPLAIAAASATVLAELYPHEVPQLSGLWQKELQRDPPAMPARTGAARDQATAMGISVARALLRERAGDGAINVTGAVLPTGPGRWISTEQWPPLRADWGRVRPLSGADVLTLAAPAPPLPGTAEFANGLTAVREARAAASAEHERIARKWAGGPGSVTPPGYWNAVAAQLIARHGLDERAASTVLSTLNAAQMDASILCWRDKFAYALLRPSQADPRIVPSFPAPNFPSYPSGHAAFSGAAAAVLAHYFPSEATEVTQLAEEAAKSRVVSGIHFPFDSEAGLAQGRRVAAFALARLRDDATSARITSIKPATGSKP